MKKIIIGFFAILIIFLYFFFYQTLIKSNQTKVSDISPPKIISQNFFSPTLTPTPVAKVTIGLMGDLGLGRYITSIARQKKDFSWSFSGVSPILKKNDFNLANLESPIITNCPEGKTGTFTFCGDPQFLPQLKINKFILNLANNHIFNYGQDGLSQTENFLQDKNIGYVFSHNPSSEFYQTEVNGINFGF